MTTKVRIENDSTSNGDVILNGVNTTEGPIHDAVIRPGEKRELWITTSSMLTIGEKWPTTAGHVPDAAAIMASGDDAAKWAKSFVQVFPAADEGLMLAWFANAIEAAHTARRERAFSEHD